MIYKAHDYQRYATDFVEKHNESLLLLEMGLGKSVISLNAAHNLLFDYFEVSKILIIAPIRVCYTWESELHKWEHLKGIKYSLVLGTQSERLNALKVAADIYIINRENIPWLVEKNVFSFDMVIIDELSSFKNYKAKRYKALNKVRPKVKRMIGLTGTPGNLMDMWAEVGLIDQGKRLGRFIGSYRETYFLPDKRNGNIIYSYKLRDGMDKEIYKKIDDITISMKACDHLDMPDIIYNNKQVELDQKEKELYKELKKEMVITYQGKELTALNAASLSNKLLQMASGCVYTEDKEQVLIHDKKIEALEDIIESLDGSPVLISYWYNSDKERLLDRFKCRCIETKKDFDDWNNRKIPVALIHPASSGYGLNLQEGGHHIVWFSLTWSLELYEQLNARLYRQGQEKGVVITHLVAKDTMDERVIKTLETKGDVQEAIMDAVKVELNN